MGHLTCERDVVFSLNDATLTIYEENADGTLGALLFGMIYVQDGSDFYERTTGKNDVYTLHGCTPGVFDLGGRDNDIMVARLSYRPYRFE